VFHQKWNEVFLQDAILALNAIPYYVAQCPNALLTDIELALRPQKVNELLVCTSCQQLVDRSSRYARENPRSFELEAFMRRSQTC